MKKILFLFSILFGLNVYSQNNDDLTKKVDQLIEENNRLNHRLDELQKLADDAMWFNRLGDVAFIDKVFIYGPPPANIKNPTAVGANNPLKFWSYVFIPKNIDPGKKYPLLVFPHGGVHAD